MPRADFEIPEPEDWMKDYTSQIDAQIEALTKQMLHQINLVNLTRSRMGERIFLVESDTPTDEYYIRSKALHETLGSMGLLDAYFNPEGAETAELELTGDTGWVAKIHVPKFSTILQVTQDAIQTRSEQDRTTVHYRYEAA